jgi:hypothetical protein
MNLLGPNGSPPWFLLAYLDPGTGSFLFQMLIAGMLSAMFMVRHSWQHLKGMVHQLPWRR